EEPAFDVYEARSNAGLVGRVGSLPGETSLGDLAAAVASNLAGSPRISGDLDDVVRTVAVVPGSGGSLVADAAATGAQLYLTGDMSHHQTVEARDRGLAVIDPGHAASERPGVAALLGAMSQLGITVVDLTVDPTPWRTP
ncbi:MAG: Nif3-like dinuclear metal center hexameric protein, partial [Acidimicrobiia bacterium]|nr:Nif3-like dinuclear metal center hexameric protein [Acidimicrobiia bacterium]